MSRAAKERRHQAKRIAGIQEQLAHPALLTDRLQPLRRTVLSLKRRIRTNEINELGE